MKDPLTESIIGAAIEVHRCLGPDLLESIYEEALCMEFDLRGIPYERQAQVDVIYKGKVIKGQRIDLIVAGEVIVEIKPSPGWPILPTPKSCPTSKQPI